MQQDGLFVCLFMGGTEKRRLRALYSHLQTTLSPLGQALLAPRLLLLLLLRPKNPHATGFS